MSGNFDFLKEIDKDLYEIITDAEKLYRDEYFEQCMAQTRRFGENICKNVLGTARTTETTFDEMLTTLKDKLKGEEQEKEFIDDLYFLKKNGNKSVHSSTVKKDYLTALECLQRAFETAISYSVYNRGAAPDILRKNYDTELLITGKPKQKSLAEKYAEEKAYNQRITNHPAKNKPSTQTKKKQKKPQSYLMAPSKKKRKYSIFWIFVGITTIISLLMVSAILLIIKF